MLTVRIDDSKLMAQLSAMPQKIQAALYKSVFTLALQLQKKIVTEKLDGQILNKRSGNLQRSIQNQVTQSDHGVLGKVFSAGDVKYAAIHEFGGRIPPHIIEPKNGEALAFMFNGKMSFFKRVNHPGSTMPERSFMRSSLREMRPEIIEAMTKAVQEATRI